MTNIAYNLILQNNCSGLFSIFNRLIGCFQTYNNIYKITWNVKNSLYGDEECFSKVFHTYINNEYKDYIIKDIICEYEGSKYLFRYTGVDAHKLYTNELCIQNNIPVNWRLDINNYWNKYIKIKPEILEIYENYKLYIESFNKKKIITFSIRHPTHGIEQINGKQPSFEQYNNAIDNLYDDNTLLICSTDSTEAFEYYSSRYNSIIFPHADRSRANECQMHGTTDKNNINKLYSVILSVLYLSLGNYYIHSVSNMATAVLYINPNISNIYLIG
jgi:hypothetical protein